MSSFSLQTLEEERFAKAGLLGKLVNICRDLPSRPLNGSSVFKAITGGDPLVGEFKFKDAFEFAPFARLLFSANDPPHTRDASPAFFRRWFVVPFERTFAINLTANREHGLNATLASARELSGVLNRAMDALPRLRSDGFTETESTRRAYYDFWTSTNPLSVWLQEETVEDPHAIVPQDVLCRAYCRFCGAWQRPGMSRKAFGSELRELRPSIGTAQRRVGEQPGVRHYKGICLKPKTG